MPSSRFPGWVPLDIRDTLPGVRSPAKREQKIRKPIQVLDHDRVDIGVMSQCDDTAFGATTDAARQMERRRRFAAARQYEGRKWLQLLIEGIDGFFYRPNSAFAQSRYVRRHFWPGLGRGEHRPDGETVSLDIDERRLPIQHLRGQNRDSEPQHAAQFIDGPVRLDAQVVFVNALPMGGTDDEDDSRQI